MKGACRFIVALSLCLCVALPPASAGPFDQGRIRVSLSGGSGGGFGNRYFVIGAGVGVFVLDGLEVGVDSDHWFGEDPAISKLSTQVRYVVVAVPVVSPYIGVLYKHWFIGSDFDDVDTVGGRLGFFYVADEHFFVGGGVVHEIIVSDCEEDCSETYPEIVFSVTF